MSIVYLTLNQFLDFASFEFYCVIRISVLRILKSSKYANPDAKEGHSDTDTSIPRPAGRRKGLNPRRRRGCTRPRRIVAAAGRGRRQSCARGRSSRAGSAPREHRHDFSRIYREQGGGTPESSRRGTGGAAREIRSPLASPMHRKPGARKSVRDQWTDTRHGKAVDRRLATQCPSAAVNSLLAGGRLSALSSHSVRVLSFRLRCPPPMHQAARHTRVLSSRRLRARRC